MSYQLCPDLSFCRVDGHLIFLDIRNDRYFRLSDSLERFFTMYLDHGGCSETEVGRLVERGLLVELGPNTEQASSLTIERPAHSVVENTPAAQSNHVSILLEVFSITCMAQVRLKTSRLERILSELTAYRRRKAHQIPPEPDEAYELRVSRAAAAFLHARPYVPVGTCCLIDSIAMVKFLAKHGMAANLVFGVSGAPFSAHCWVQVGALVLNDTVGNTHAHTPIRVV